MIETPLFGLDEATDNVLVTIGIEEVVKLRIEPRLVPALLDAATR